jgi:hypothetical protein
MFLKNGPAMSSGHYGWLELKWPTLPRQREKLLGKWFLEHWQKEKKKRMAGIAHMNSEPPVQCQHVMPSSANQQRNVRKLALFNLVLAIVLVSINYASFSSIVGYRLAHEVFGSFLLAQKLSLFWSVVL